MAHLEINLKVDHCQADGLEVPHTLQVKIDGLDASAAWDRAAPILDSFLSAEEHLQARVNDQVQAAEGPWCNHNHYDSKINTGYLCNLPPDHRQSHQNFQSGRTWPLESWQPREDQCA